MSIIIARIVVVALLVLGTYNLHTQGYFTKVNNTLSYAAQHIVPQDRCV